VAGYAQPALFDVDACQRWAAGREVWAPALTGERFDPRRYTVEPIGSDRTAEAFVVANHYSGSYVAAVHRFGLYAAGVLVGVAVYSNPATDLVLTNVFPDLTPFRESTELGRFVLLDAVPGNAESWFLARCHEQLAARGVAGVVSFADPVPRRDRAGMLVTPGHVGTIYQASNALYTGRSCARSLWVLPGGTVVNGQALQKIREQKRGHRYAEEQLTAAGARPMAAGEDPRAWLAEAKAACGVRTFRHPGLHRFAFALGRNARARRSVRIALDAQPYPKHRETRELVAS
jgi:hypothetical protein